MAAAAALIVLIAQLVLFNPASASTPQPDSTSKLGHNVNTAVDAIYIIGLAHCETRRQYLRTWASEHDLRITVVDATPYTAVDLDDPPIPIVGVPSDATVTAGQVGCTFSHIRVWRDAFERNLSRIIVLEDDVRLSRSLMRRLDLVFRDADGGARARRTPWHYLYLRMRATDDDDDDDDESEAAARKSSVWQGGVHQAAPGWGTAAYALSATGLRYLLTRVTAYSFPIDVQIERLQRGQDMQGAPFVALHSCRINMDGSFPQDCPDDVEELSLNEKVGCFESATAVGASMRGIDFPAPLE